MPLYEFLCADCGTQFELLATAGYMPTCPACDSARVQRLVSLFAVRSDETSQASLSAARQTASKTAQEKAVAEQEVAARHSHDDH